MPSKKQRIENRGLVEFAATLPCMHCGVEPAGDAHHITSVAAGGDDVAENLMPLCRKAHSMVHQIGLAEMASRFPAIATWLEEAGRSEELEKRKSRVTQH